MSFDKQEIIEAMAEGILDEWFNLGLDEPRPDEYSELAEKIAELALNALVKVLPDVINDKGELNVYEFEVIDLYQQLKSWSE